MITQGTWGIGGWKLPDLGISEKLGIGTPNPNRSMTFPVNVQNGQIQGIPVSSYNTPTPTKITTNNAVKTNYGSGYTATPSNTAQPYIDQVNQNTSDYNGLIDQDYNNAINYLGQQEQGLRSQADIAQQEIGTGFQSAINQLGQEQSTATSGVQSQLSTGEKESQSALQQARDMFRQTQQNNIAQLSAAGLSSSSVNEALAERLGVETARRIYSVTGSLSEIRQNAVKEMARIADYYQQKKSNLEQVKATEISKIQSALVQGLNQINYSRAVATADKAKARFDLLSNAQQQVASIQQQAQQFEQSLKTWANEKSTNLNNIYSNPDWLNQFTAQKSVLEQTYNPSQFNITPTINQSSTGNMSGSWIVKPKTVDDIYSTNLSPTNTTDNPQLVTW